MSPSPHLVLPAATVLAALLAEALHGTAAVVAVVAVAAGGLVASVVIERRRARRIVARLSAAVPEGPVGWSEVERRADIAAAELRRADAAADEPLWHAQLVASIQGPALLFAKHEERLVAANDAAQDLFGIPTPTRGLTLIQALGSAALAVAAREARDSGRPVQVDAEVHARELRATASVMGDGILVMVTDQTEQRRTEELRRNFVVNASHELKTPATAIQTLSEALEVALEQASDRIPQLVARLREESERLVRMVHDLLDLRRLEDRGPLAPVPVDLAALIRDVAGQLAGRAEDRGVVIEVDAPSRARVVGLPQDLGLVVQNLMANAIQYNREGGRVQVGLAAENGAYVLTVTDTGIGIARHDLQRVFERFYRVDVARSRDSGGTGLGLSIVRHAVERHGGSVQAESLLGEGSTFTVRLPIEPGG